VTKPTLTPVPLDAVPIAGIAERESTADGVVLHRYPASVRREIGAPGLAVYEPMPAGARLLIRTDAEAIEIDAALMRYEIADLPPPLAAFDLVVDGSLAASTIVDDTARTLVGPAGDIVDVVPAAPSTIRFDLPGDAGARVEVWLPHAVVVALREVRISSGATLHRAHPLERMWVHYGSSISHCLEAPRPTETWPAVVARAAGVELVNLAVAGQCVLDGPVARLIRDTDTDLISLKLGINVLNADVMRERAFVPALHNFIATIREGKPSTPLVVATPIAFPGFEEQLGPSVYRGPHRFDAVERPPELRVGALTLARIRELIGEVVGARQAAGDSELHLLDGLTLLGPEDADLLVDGLHPGPAGYRLIAERFREQAFGPGQPFAADAG